MSQQKRLFLLDAYALIFRGYYAFIKNPRINSKGMDTSAIFGFTNSLLDVIKREKPDHLAVAFDKGGSTVRTEMYQEYKANRDATPEAIKIAVPYIQEILRAMHIPVIEEAGCEADDLIGTLAKQAEKEGYQVFMVTPDKDFAQLVSENIFMYRPARLGNGIEIWGVPEVLERFEIERPEQVIDFLGMMGDAVDNIPGLPGVGEKTAKKFLKDYGSMENLLANTHELKGKMRENIEANKEKGIMSKKLATIITDCNVTFDEKDYELTKPDSDKVEALFNELEFRRMAEQFQKLFGDGQEFDNVQSQGYAPTKTITGGEQQFSLFDEGAADENALAAPGFYNTLDIKGLHKQIDFKLLLNEHVKLEKGGQEIALVGVENWGVNFKQAGDLGKASQGLNKEDFKILMSHDPSHWEHEVKDHPNNYHLTLSGHTHGLQFGIEIPGFFKWSPVQYVYKQWAGLYENVGRYIYVNRGFGFHAYPGRVGIWPEITVIELKKGEKAV